MIEPQNDRLPYLGHADSFHRWAEELHDGSPSCPSCLKPAQVLGESLTCNMTWCRCMACRWPFLIPTAEVCP